MTLPMIADLTQFQSPETLHAKVTPEALAIPSDIFFNSSDPLYQKYREAWAASLFGRGFSKHVRPCEVRLVEEDFPDFEIRTNREIHAFEFTEVQQPEIRRGDHYKEHRGEQIYEISVHHATIEEAAVWIANGIAAKANKHYGAKVHLLLYANFWVAEKIGLTKVRKLCCSYASAFRSVWLLFAVSMAQVFENAEFENACNDWQVIPQYLEESMRRMGIVDSSQ